MFPFLFRVVGGWFDALRKLADRGEQAGSICPGHISSSEGLGESRAFSREHTSRTSRASIHSQGRGKQGGSCGITEKIMLD